MHNLTFITFKSYRKYDTPHNSPAFLYESLDEYFCLETSTAFCEELF